jgi:non-canonical purine NTP pyrophosphatase (RdgB/HAM1 family)
VDGGLLVDLAYVEDSAAEVDLNLVLTKGGELVEVQGSAEKGLFSPAELGPHGGQRGGGGQGDFRGPGRRFGAGDRAERRFMRMVLASGNKGKLREIKAILEPKGIAVKTAAHELGFTEDVEETGSTFAENAELKALTVARALNLPVLADDSGLAVDALDGAPGVYSARYSGPGATDAKNCQKLHEALKDVPQEKRGAAFVCVMCCAKPDGSCLHAPWGGLRGASGLNRPGYNGFGYDPVFFVPEKGCTAAQMSA